MATRLRMGETAQRLGLSQDTVREWVRRGFLKARRTPTGQLLFDEADVEAARRGDRPATGPVPSTAQTAIDPMDRGVCVPTWKKLPPWETKVQAARASLTLEELEAERKARIKARESEGQRAVLAQRQAAQEEAQRQRLNAMKIRVIRSVWIPAEYRSEVVESIERFVTPERLPSWLAEWEQFDLVATHARTVVQKLQTDEERRLADERTKEEQRINAENERQRQEFAAKVAASLEPKDSSLSSPRSVAEALRRRRITEE